VIWDSGRPFASIAARAVFVANVTPDPMPTVGDSPDDGMNGWASPVAPVIGSPPILSVASAPKPENPLAAELVPPNREVSRMDA
jgi:hypothetical protein